MILNDKQLKGLLDLVVKTVNDLSKHHAGETLDIVTGEIAEQAVGFTKNLDTISTTVNKLNDDQTTAYEELTEAIKRIDSVDDAFTEKLQSLSDDSICKQDALRDMCNDLFTRIDELTGLVAEKTPKDVVEELHNSLDTVERAHEDAIDVIVTDIVKANDHIGKLKKSLIGYGDDLRTLSDAMHARMGDCEAKNTTVTEDIANATADIVQLTQANDALLKSVDAHHESLIDKFNQLKNESFLSSDKIDMKFAEMKLNLVELDVERENRVKAAVSEQGDEILAQLNEDLKAYRIDINEKLSDSKSSIVGDVELMLKSKSQNIMNSKSWVPGDWSQGAVCRNRGGLWQAIRDTDAEPSAESGDWICGASGFHSAQVIATHATGLNVTVGVEDTLGNVHEIKIPLPKINYIKGTYEPAQDYLYNDSVMKDGCRWVATKDHPIGIPGDEKTDWEVLTMRGPKGHQGNAGDTGPRGITGEKGSKGDKGAAGAKGDDGLTPEMNDIVKALVDFESDGDGQAIRRARGHWKLGTSYKSGDVVSVGNGLFVALRNNDGTLTPAGSTEDWLLLIQVSGGGGTSAPVSEFVTPTFGVRMF